ncbi:hypothetical protein [Lacipirellula sp.]|uniref:hypothetical protein n=1 Tax=Lacipirellula sp. TaxID=2691419 RepID=UPI003D136D0E
MSENELVEGLEEMEVEAAEATEPELVLLADVARCVNAASCQNSTPLLRSL